MNVFTFSGRIGQDATVRDVGQGKVAGFSVAVKAGMGKNEQTLWIDCSIWGKRAEGGLPQYLLKGQQVVVSGELSTREHNGKTYMQCRVSELSLVGGQTTDAQPQGYQQAPAQPQQQGGGDPFNDDIPFARAPNI